MERLDEEHVWNHKRDASSGSGYRSPGMRPFQHRVMAFDSFDYNAHRIYCTSTLMRKAKK